MHVRIRPIEKNYGNVGLYYMLLSCGRWCSTQCGSDYVDYVDVPYIYVFPPSTAHDLRDLLLPLHANDYLNWRNNVR